MVSTTAFRVFINQKKIVTKQLKTNKMTNEFYSATVRHTKQMENGTFKRVSEPFLLVANSYTDAEAIIYKEVIEYLRGECKVKIAKQRIEQFLNADSTAETIFKIVVAYEVWNDNGESKKKNKINYAVKAETITEAIELVREDYEKFTMVDGVVINNITRTDFVDYFPAQDAEFVETEEIKSTVSFNSVDGGAEDDQEEGYEVLDADDSDENEVEENSESEVDNDSTEYLVDNDSNEPELDPNML
jgi:hypothetical protein